MTYSGRLACAAFLVSLGLWGSACGEAGGPLEGDETGASDAGPSFDASSVPNQRRLNEAPTAAITSPSAGQVIQAGDPVSFAGIVGDLESPRETLSVQWLSDLSGLLHQGQANEAGSTTFVRDDLLAGTHTLTLVVVDEGGKATETSREFVINGPPSQAQVRIEPAEPRTGDDMQVIVAQGSEDPNRASSELTYRYTWFKGDELKQTSSTVLSSQTTKGETWRVEVRANDGMVDGLSSSVEVTIANSAPSCEAALILPAAGKTDETFTCSCPGREEPDPGDPNEDTCTFESDGIWLADGCTLPAEATTKGMNLTCTLTPGDGEDAGAPSTSSSAPVMNSLPTSPEVALSPVEAAVGTLLTCEVTGASSDLDQDTLTYETTWYVNGFANPGTSSASVIAGTLVRDSEGTLAGGGDQIFCRVVANDNAGGLSNPADSQVIALLNSPPYGGAVIISPPTGTESDILSCVATEAVDPDGQDVLWSYQWFLEDEAGELAPIIDGNGLALTGASFDRGDVVSCSATPSDGISSGEPVASKNKVTISNSLPSLEGASLSPPLVDAYGEFFCNAYGWNDLDGDPEELAYAWIVVGEDSETIIPGQVGATLQAATLAPGEVVRCRVTPKNGEALGEPVVSGEGEVQNDPPSLESATLTPEEPTVAATLVCAPSGYSDLEGSAPNYIYSWKRNNEDIVGATSSTLSEGFHKGDVVRCVITPNDGIDNGAPVPSNEVTILNTLPQLGSVSVSPDFVAPCETLSCEVADLSEPDEADTLTFAYRWELNGAPIPPVTKTLSAALYAPNDTLRCYAKPTDGSFKQLPNGGVTTVWGEELPSNLATVINTPPSVASVEISPVEAQVGDILTCTPVGFEDPDCTPAALFHYIWYVNGETVDDAEGQTFSLDEVNAGAKVQCQAIPDDGYTQGSGKISAVVTVLNAPPTSPVVTIEAPEGSQGGITCAFQVESFDTDPLTYTWYWQVNAEDEVVGEQTLASEATSDCDLVRCRVEVSDGLSTTPSNVAALNLPSGPGCEDDNPCTSHACAPEGGCVSNFNTLACDDGDPCTANDACALGSCVGDVNGCDDGNICTIDTCNPISGCVHSYDPGACDDANPCTSDLCDLATGACVNTVLEDGTLCEGDGNGCTESDSCFGGTCIVGAAVNCPGEPNVCQYQLCESLSAQAYICKAVFADESVACDDGLQCTTQDHCNGSGTCVPGDFLDCSPGAGPCQLGSCVEGEGCSFTAAPDGTLCNSDSNGCTQADSCSEGLCLPGSPVDCSLEGGPCKVGFCESTGASSYACAFAPTLAGTPCDAGDWCFTDAYCDGEGACDGGTPRDCEAEVGSVCHTAYCDSHAELCIPIKAADGTGCDDGSTCTITDACQNGYCQGSGDACREEALSVALSGSSKPDVADLGYGRYVVQYAGSSDEVAGKVYDYIRLNDAYGSREDEELEIAGEVMANADQTLTQFTTPTAVAPNGNFLTTSWTGNGCSCVSEGGCSCETGELVVRSFDYLGEQIAENLALDALLFQVEGSGTQEGQTEMTQLDISTVAFADGGWGIFKIRTMESSASGSIVNTHNTGVLYTPLTANLMPGTPVEILNRLELSHKRLFDIVPLPESDEFLLVWVHALYKLGLPRWDQLYMQRFSSLGVALTDPKLIYENKDPDAHDTRAMEARYIDATGEVLIVWDDQRLASGPRRVRWLWSTLTGEMIGDDTHAAFDAGLGDQRLADVDIFSDGGFVITWDDDAGDVDGYSAKARVFEVDGSPTSGELALNREGAGDQITPGVAVLANDEWVAAFRDDTGRVWTRRYDREGSDAVGQLERHANATMSGPQYDVEGAQGGSKGDVLISWTSPYAGNSGSEIIARRLDDEGLPITAETQVNASVSGVQSHPTVAPLGDGWLVVWQSETPAPLGLEVIGRLVDASGSPTGPELTLPSLGEGDQTRPALAAGAVGAIVAFESDASSPGVASDILVRPLSLEGEGLGEDILISSGALSYRPAIAAKSDGGYIVAWESKGGPDWDVYVRHLDSAGTPLGEATLAHATTQLDQGNASVAVGPGAYFIVCVDTTTNSGATATGVSCQRMTSSELEPIGPEILPAPQGSAQAHTALTYLPDGSWVVAWDSEEIDGDGSAIQLQRYSAFGVSVGQRIVANRSWQGHQSHPVLISTGGAQMGLIVSWEQGEADERDTIYRFLPGL